MHWNALDARLLFDPFLVCLRMLYESFSWLSPDNVRVLYPGNHSKSNNAMLTN